MISSENVTKNLEDWLQNPSWKEIYENSPSEACKAFIAMMFYASETEEDEAFNEMDRLESKLDLRDLMYMYDNSMGPQKKHFYQKMAEARRKQ